MNKKLDTIIIDSINECIKERGIGGKAGIGFDEPLCQKIAEKAFAAGQVLGRKEGLIPNCDLHDSVYECKMCAEQKGRQDVFDALEEFVAKKEKDVQGRITIRDGWLDMTKEERQKLKEKFGEK